MSEHETAEQKIARLERENAELRSTRRPAKEISFKVSAKGGVSVYGLGRFPVTLYREQWERLLDNEGKLRSFIEENGAQLKTKS